MKKRVEKQVLSAVEHLVRNDVKRERFSWPPPCPLFSHQPKRPESEKAANE